MKARSRHSSKLTFHPIVIASAVVFVVLFLALGYHAGVNRAEQVHGPRLLAVNQQRAEEDKKLKECAGKNAALIDKVGKSNVRVAELQKAVDELRRQQDEALASYKGLDEENNKCTIAKDEVENTLNKQNTQDAQTREEVEDLTKEVDALRVSIQQITRGEGMSVVLLKQVLANLRQQYETRCRQQPGCVELTDEDLLQQRITLNRTEDEIQHFLKRDTEMQDHMVNSLQGPNADLSGIFFYPPVAEEGQYSPKNHSPTYFGRGIFEKPLVGVGARHVTHTRLITSVVTLLETFSNYAMCAYRYNTSHFSFQSFFLYGSGGIENNDGNAMPIVKRNGSLHELIVTPLLQYCNKCDAQVWTPQYHLACFKDRMYIPENYGRRDFWIVRSMVQASPVVQSAALHYYEARELEKQRVLAVVQHLETELDKRECDRETMMQHGLHYQYLKANFKDDPALQLHSSENLYEQCAPTAAQIIAYVIKVRQNAAQSFDKIYLSVSDDMRETIMSILNANGDTDMKDLILPAFKDAEKEAAMPGFNEMVDLEIASRATDIIVSPFLRPSRYVTENFLLRHKLVPGGHVWVF